VSSIHKKAIIFFGDDVSIYLTDLAGFSCRKIHYWGSKCDRVKILQDISACGIGSFGIINQGDREESLRDFIRGLTQNGIEILCIQDGCAILQNFLRSQGLESGFFLDWEDGFFSLYDFNGGGRGIKTAWPAPLSEFSFYIELSRSKMAADEKLLLSGPLSLLRRNLAVCGSADQPQIPEDDKRILCSPSGADGATGIMCRELSRLPEYSRSLFSTIFLTKIASLGLMFFLMFFLSGFFSPYTGAGLRVTEILQAVTGNFTAENESEAAQVVNFHPDINYCGPTENETGNCGHFLYFGQAIQLCEGFESRRLQVKRVSSDEALLLVNDKEILLQKTESIKAYGKEKIIGSPGLMTGFSTDGHRHVRVNRDLPFWNLRSGDKIKSFHGYDLHRPSDLKLFNILAENSYPLSGFDIL
jgi:hypothetical protein